MFILIQSRDKQLNQITIELIWCFYSWGERIQTQFNGFDNANIKTQQYTYNPLSQIAIRSLDFNNSTFNALQQIWGSLVLKDDIKARWFLSKYVSYTRKTGFKTNIKRIDKLLEKHCTYNLKTSMANSTTEIRVYLKVKKEHSTKCLCIYKKDII